MLRLCALCARTEFMNCSCGNFNRNASDGEWDDGSGYGNCKITACGVGGGGKGRVKTIIEFV